MEVSRRQAHSWSTIAPGRWWLPVRLSAVCWRVQGSSRTDRSRLLPTYSLACRKKKEKAKLIAANAAATRSTVQKEAPRAEAPSPCARMNALNTAPRILTPKAPPIERNKLPANATTPRCGCSPNLLIGHPTRRPNWALANSGERHEKRHPFISRAIAGMAVVTIV
jgi:hypothetical protein